MALKSKIYVTTATMVSLSVEAQILFIYRFRETQINFPISITSYIQVDAIKTLNRTLNSVLRVTVSTSQNVTGDCGSKCTKVGKVPEVPFRSQFLLCDEMRRDFVRAAYGEDRWQGMGFRTAAYRGRPRVARQLWQLRSHRPKV